MKDKKRITSYDIRRGLIEFVAIFIAVSLAMDPPVPKNTRFKLEGANSANLAANSAG